MFGDIRARRHQRGARSKSGPHKAEEGQAMVKLLPPIVDPLLLCHVVAIPLMLKSNQPHRRKTENALKVYVERSIPRDRHGIKTL